MKTVGKIQVGDRLVRGEEQWAVLERERRRSVRGGGESVWFRCKDGKGEVREIVLPVEDQVEVR